MTYYAPPGHLPTLFAGSEIVEFHPTEALMQTMEIVLGTWGRPDDGALIVVRLPLVRP